MDSGVIFPKRGKIALGDGETSSTISKNDYEVFLSFRGPDTRQGFTDCLYHALVDSGIGVFRDDDELQIGVKIDEILHALDNSKICIVVLSPTFAESAWCLREVERMVDMKKDIVPIFYHVTSDDVKLKTELYANALTMHEINRGKEKVQKWRDALKEIPTIKGRGLKNTGFIEFSRQIAKEILTKLKVKHKFKITNFVEVSDEVESALKMLDIGSGGFRYLGIHGMGGIGKTTLAKIIFNQISDSFDCSCFLENIRESLSQGQGGVHKLQEHMLRSLDPSLRHDSQIFDGLEKIKNSFSRKKVILVLDDIDDKIHFRGLVGSFGNGSRIIFTTRNAELHEETISSNADFYGLEKKEMDSKQSLKLFSRHAFGGDSLPKEFEVLSMEVISTTGGLPLALEVVGSFLHRRKAKVWREMIKKLKESPHQDVQRKLKLSYDALEYEQQEIFLDIACFFIGVEKANVVYMWEACGFYPNNGIEVLISMSLIKLNKKKCFWMHDQLRDLGRAIVKVNSTDVRAGSRLWMHKDALDLLKTNGGKERVEALHLDGDCVYLDRENFVGLEKLRFFRLTNSVNFDGDFSGLIPKLRWMSLVIAPSFNVTNLYLRELVVLELSWCKFDETWPGWGQILISQQLKVLSLSDCHELISTPDLSKVVNLERLVVERCVKLTSLHRSVGKLQCLRRLSIIGCDSLREFPEELYSLESLKHIIFRTFGYRSLQFQLPSSQFQLPNSIGRLVSLTRLELERVVHLPNSIGELVKLKHLSLSYSLHLRVLPDSIGDLKSLIRLDLANSKITELPTTIGRLAKLESLNLLSCKELQRLPGSIGNLQSLVDLNMSGCRSIAELPHSFGNLASLQTFNLRDSRDLRVLHDSIGDLRSLIRLDLSDTMITELPTTIGRLTKLESLNLFCCKELQRLPDSIGNLQSLVDLNMSSCESIVELPHSVGNLATLIRLELSDTMITELPTTIGRLAKLESLDLSDCERLQRLSDSIGNLESLVNLDISGCQSIAELPHSAGNLASLQTLNLEGLSVRLLPDSIKGLEKLKRLDIGSIRELLEPHRELIWENLPNLPNGLSYLNVRCVQKIQNLCNLINLFHLEIHNEDILVNELVEFEGIHKLSKLEQLLLRCCNVKSLSMEWGGLHQLKSLVLWCPSLEFGQCQLPWSLESLSLDVKKWGNLPYNLSSLKNLSELGLTNFVIEEADSVKGLDSLEVLKMNKCILKCNDFPVLKRLRNLILDRCRSHLTSSHVEDDSDEQLPVIGSEFQNQLSTLKNLSELQLLNFSMPHDGFKVIGVEGLECLVDLRMKNCILFEFTNNLSLLRNLRSFHLYNCSFHTMACIRIPPQLNHLVDLSISSCKDLVEIQGIGNLKSLTKLSIMQCPSFQRIEGLVELNGLETIDIWECHKFDGIDGVEKLLLSGTLSQLTIIDCKCKVVNYPF